MSLTFKSYEWTWSYFISCILYTFICSVWRKWNWRKWTLSEKLNTLQMTLIRLTAMTFFFLTTETKSKIHISLPAFCLLIHSLFFPFSFCLHFIVCCLKELKLKDEECERLSKVRDQLGQELEELTASLFEVCFHSFGFFSFLVK